MELEQGVSAALGVTVDPDGDAVVLVVIGTEQHQVAVPLMPDVAIAYGKAMQHMAVEARALQTELDTLGPEEVQARLKDIQQRYAAQNN
jgi:hypothetical protein